MEKKKQKGHASSEEKAYRHIINLILNGKVNPGEFLLEEELAADMNMSRTPISRALSRMVTEGFIDKLPKKGCFVPIPTPEDAEEVFIARKAIERKTTERATMRATDEELLELESVISKDEHAVIAFSKDTYSNNNEALHLGIAKLSRNPYLERWCRYIYWRSSLYIFYFDRFYIAGMQSEVPPQFTPVQHAALLDAMKKRTSDLAGKLMEDHVWETYLQLFRRS